MRMWHYRFMKDDKNMEQSAMDAMVAAGNAMREACKAADFAAATKGTTHDMFKQIEAKALLKYDSWRQASDNLWKIRNAPK